MLQVAFERSRGSQSVDMICRELMLDGEKSQTPKRPRTRKKKGVLKNGSQAADEALAPVVDANKTGSSCSVNYHFVTDVCPCVLIITHKISSMSVLSEACYQATRCGKAM